MTLTPHLIVPGAYHALTLSQYSPWGRIQHSEVLMWGKDRQTAAIIPLLWQVSTASHGGTRVHDQIAKAYFSKLPPDCHAYGGSHLWFEEDCESSVPFYVFYNGLSPQCWLMKNKPFPRANLLNDFARHYPEATQGIQNIARRFDDDLAAAGIALRDPTAPTTPAA